MNRPRVDQLGHIPTVVGFLLAAALITAARHLAAWVEVVDNAHDIEETP